MPTPPDADLRSASARSGRLWPALRWIDARLTGRYALADFSLSNASRRPSLVSASIGPYQVLEKLGAGGMGEVYLAEDPRLHRKVALKSLSEARLHDPVARERLLREARAAAQLNHPNIAAVYDVLESQERAYIVMEYVQGETLSQRVRRERLPAERVIQIGIQLAEALAAAHAQGVIHRDLKPSNVHLTPEGRVKVLDFGLAKTLLTKARATGETATLDDILTDAGKVIGTPAYMSPEQISGREVDRRSDIYGLGVMLFEMLVGRRPFEARDPLALGVEILTQPTPTPSEIDPRVPREMSAIVGRAMARRPEDRYQSAEELRADLARLATDPAELATRSMVTSPPGTTTVRARALRRLGHPAVVLGLVAVLAAVAATLPNKGRIVSNLVDFIRRSPPPPPSHTTPVVAVLPFSNLTGDPSNDYIGVSIADVLVTNLANMQGLTVVSRSATLVYREERRQIPEIIRELGATLVVDGGFQPSGDRVQVTVRLVRPDDSVAWGRVFEGRTSDLFRLQADIEHGVSEGLQLNLTPRDRRRLERPPTENLGAYAGYARGRALLERPDVAGNIDKSIEMFKEAIQTDSRFALAHAALGEAYWTRYRETQDRSSTQKAIDSILEALRLDSTQAHVWISLALVHHGTGRSEAAVDDLRRALSLQPFNDEAHLQLGSILADLGQTDQALAELRRAIDLRPNYWRHHARLGLVYYRKGRFAEAMAALRRAIQLQPDNAWVYQMLGTVYQSAGDNPQALENYQRAIKLSPMAEAYSNMGSIYYEEGKYADAARAHEEAVKLLPNDPHPHRNLGDAYLKLGFSQKAHQSYAEAVQMAQRLLQVNPKDARTLAMLAVCEAKLGRRKQANQHAREAVALAPADSSVLYRRVIVHALAGEQSQAIEALRKSLDSGYSPELAQKDDDLVSLKNSKQFKALVARKH